MSDENVVNKTEGYEGWVIILKIVTIILPIQNVSKIYYCKRRLMNVTAKTNGFSFQV